ncbi:MAG: hypothetical protein ABIE74_04315 [Pseudomonadota bacterium]
MGGRVWANGIPLTPDRIHETPAFNDDVESNGGIVDYFEVLIESVATELRETGSELNRRIAEDLDCFGNLVVDRILEIGSDEAYIDTLIKTLPSIYMKFDEIKEGLLSSEENDARDLFTFNINEIVCHCIKFGKGEDYVVEVAESLKKMLERKQKQIKEWESEGKFDLADMLDNTFSYMTLYAIETGRLEEYYDKVIQEMPGIIEKIAHVHDFCLSRGKELIAKLLNRHKYFIVGKALQTGGLLQYIQDQINFLCDW